MVIKSVFPSNMYENLSLQQLKGAFTRKTGLPAKKMFVVVAAPSMQGCAMHSKADWIRALENIEMVLVPVAKEDSSQHDSVEVPDNNVSPEPPDAEVEKIEEQVKRGETPLLEIFTEGFVVSEDPKRLYRKLAKRLHPDAGGDAQIFDAMKRAFDAYKTSQLYQLKQHGLGTKYNKSDFYQSTLSNEEFDDWLS